MRITCEGVGIGTGLGAPVPSFDYDFDDGIPEYSADLASTVNDDPPRQPAVPVVIAVQSDERPLLVSMLLGGRIRPDSGRILINGRHDIDELRRCTALVDTPVVSEPSAGVALRIVVAEEFAFAGMPTSARSVRRFLVDHGLEPYSALAIRALPPADRIRIFSELALLRPDVTALVITSPERHGGATIDWYPALQQLAARGTLVVIVTDFATADSLRLLGAHGTSTSGTSASQPNASQPVLEGPPS